MFVYSADDSKDSIQKGIEEKLWPYYRLSIERLEENWFYVRAKED